MVTSAADAAPQFPAGPPATPRDTPFLQDPMQDRLVRAIVTLTMELSVTRERLQSIEFVLSREGRHVSDEIEALSLTPAEDERRRSDREKLIAAVLGPLL